MLSVDMLCVGMLRVGMLSVIMLSVVMLRVVAPFIATTLGLMFCFYINHFSKG